MEAQIARVSAELKRLQGSEASAPLGRADTSAGKATHLEEQLNVLIQQRLKHLETIQCQQIQLQVLMPNPLEMQNLADLKGLHYSDTHYIIGLYTVFLHSLFVP